MNFNTLTKRKNGLFPLIITNLPLNINFKKNKEDTLNSCVIF